MLRIAQTGDEMTTATIAVTPQRYEDEIAAREQILSELSARIADDQDRERIALAAIIVGEATESDVKGIRWELEGHLESKRVTTLEVEGLRLRLAESLANADAGEKQRVLETVVAPAAVELATLLRTLELKIQEAGQALGAAIEASGRAYREWPLSGSNYKPRTIYASRGHAVEKQFDYLISHIWAILCAASGERLPYHRRPEISQLCETGEAYLHHSCESVSLAERFAASWPGLLEKEAGRPDLAVAVRKAIEGKPSKREKAAA
jgi:hypothetical protein